MYWKIKMGFENSTSDAVVTEMLTIIIYYTRFKFDNRM